MQSPISVVGGYVEVPEGPGLGIKIDWDHVQSHDSQQPHSLELFAEGWERRGSEVPGH